ncbi:MAG: flavodoxin family protein [Clostridia bacterium]|nr:flavodoxin family protein [Clostridia bacterium]
MAKVLLFNGSPHEFGCTYTALSEVKKTLEQEGVQADIFWIGKEVRGCVACFRCGELKKCVFEDKVNEALALVPEYDGFVFGAPVYYAGPAGTMCCFMDRLFMASKGRFAGKLGASVVSCRRGGASASFDRLNKYFGISNMTTVGAQYWNQVHGSKPEDVLKDEEGLQSMRFIGKNMAYLIRCREQSGIPFPEFEAKINTSFIR